MDNLVARRVNGTMMASSAWEGQQVKICGKLRQTDSATWALDASDGKTVDLQTWSPSKTPDGFVECLGEVLAGGALRVKEMHELGSDMDMDLLNSAINMSFVPELAPFFDPNSE